MAAKILQDGVKVQTAAGADAFEVDGSTGAVTISKVLNNPITSAALATNVDVSSANWTTVGGGAGTTTVEGLSGGVAGQYLVISSASSGRTIVLVHNGTGTQKFLCPNSANLTLRPYGTVLAFCDGTYWRLFAI